MANSQVLFYLSHWLWEVFVWPWCLSCLWPGVWSILFISHPVFSRSGNCFCLNPVCSVSIGFHLLWGFVLIARSLCLGRIQLFNVSVVLKVWVSRVWSADVVLSQCHNLIVCGVCFITNQPFSIYWGPLNLEAKCGQVVFRRNCGAASYYPMILNCLSAWFRCHCLIDDTSSVDLIRVLFLLII